MPFALRAKSVLESRVFKRKKIFSWMKENNPYDEKENLNLVQIMSLNKTFIKQVKGIFCL